MLIYKTGLLQIAINHHVDERYQKRMTRSQLAERIESKVASLFTVVVYGKASHTTFNLESDEFSRVL